MNPWSILRTCFRDMRRKKKQPFDRDEFNIEAKLFDYSGYFEDLNQPLIYDYIENYIIYNVVVMISLMVSLLII